MEEEENKKIKEKKVIKVNDFSLFAPKSARILYEDYPELKQHGDTFKLLSTVDLLFVWYYACEASPFFVILNERTRVDECIKATYNKGSKKIDEGYKDSLKNLVFPDKIQKAILAMSKFRVGPRLRAKIVAEKIFDNLEKILDIDASDDLNFVNKEGDLDWSKKKAYMDTAAKAIDIMPTLLTQLESSFSISDKKKIDTSDEGEDDQSYMDQYHEQRS